MEKDSILSESPEALHKQTSEALTQYEPKRKRGRPPGSKNKPSEQNSPKPETPIDPGIAQANLVLVQKTANAVLGTVDSLVVSGLVKKASKLGAPENFQIDIATSVSMSEDEKTIAAECCSTIVSRNQLLLRYAPEVMLACVVASYGSRVLMVTAKLDALASKVAKTKARHEPVTSE